MKHTIAVNRQLFNVKAIANAKKVDAMADGELGVFAVGSETSVASNIAFAALPAEFMLISKLNGTLYHSFSAIKKTEMRDIVSQAYKAPKVNIWEGTIKHCKCIKTATIRINLEEESLMRRDGFSWNDTDGATASAPTELTCACDCNGKEVYDNNIMTKALVKQVNDLQSQFYSASIKMDVAGIATSGTFPVSPKKGDVYLKTGATAGLNVYDGAAWKVIGTAAGVITDIDTYLEATKDRNTDEEDTGLADGALLTIVLTGKPQAAGNYADLDISYLNPRGVKLFPSISINGGEANIAFTETQEIQYEMNTGADLRANEWEHMNYYTNLNNQVQLHDGLIDPNVKYQFENSKNYDVLNFEYYTDKTKRNDGDKRSFGVLIATETPATFTALKTMFGA